ncbi:MAG: ThiF family adenylyltransferase [Candidatus Micrarchaeia archaeon]
MQKTPACKSRLASANLSSIGPGGQRSLSRACVGIAGLGGVGGIAFELLLRAGIDRLKISDSGFFEESNANRQSLWSRENDGQKKTAAALAFASSIGSRCSISEFAEITRSNSSQFARGCAAVIDATDTPSSRMAVFSGCKKYGVPYIFASARGHCGMLSVFSGRDFPREFSISKAKKCLPCDHALGPVANAIGCIAAQQAMNAALKKPLVLFPNVLSIDAFSGKIAIVHEF